MAGIFAHGHARMRTARSTWARASPASRASCAWRTIWADVLPLAHSPSVRLSLASPFSHYFTGNTADGQFKNISLEQYKGKWVVLFFYPLDFTFVCK